MKLITHLKSSCIVLICLLIICSHSIPVERPFCKRLRIPTFITVSDSNHLPSTTIGLLLADSQSLSLQLSWNASAPGFQLSIVRVASGSPVWHSRLPAWSTVLVLCLDRNGNFEVRSRRSSQVLWKSQVHKMQVRNVQLLVDEKKFFLRADGIHAKDLHQQRIDRNYIPVFRPTKLLQENSSPTGIGGDDADGPDSLAYTQEATLIESSSLSPTATGLLAVDDGNEGHRNKKLLAMEIIFPVVGFLLLLALCLAVYLSRKRRKNKSTLSKRNIQSSFAKKSMARIHEDEVLIENLAPLGLPPRFTYAEMEQATNRFTRRLGEGAYGAVFGGMLASSGSRVAVKVFSNTESTACRNGFCKEVLSIGSKKHEHLVPLLGFCVEDEHRMIVYELMENGSLNRQLFGANASEKACSLRWERRVAIAVGTAKALAFLHEEGEQKRAVVHCDLKPENILLDENWEAKVSDFGLAKLLWGGASEMRGHHDDGDDDEFIEGKHEGGRPAVASGEKVESWGAGSLSSLVSSKGIRGTLGYLAPEWVRADGGSGSITTASDVYSFGVVLLELLAGRRSMVPGRPFLLGQAFDVLAAGHDLTVLLDPTLFDGAPLATSPAMLEDARKLVKIGLWCLQDNPTLRPSMAAVMNMITGNDAVDTPPFCDYFAGSSHFFDEVEYPVRASLLFNSDKTFEPSSPISSSTQESWQISILSGR